MQFILQRTVSVDLMSRPSFFATGGGIVPSETVKWFNATKGWGSGINAYRQIKRERSLRRVRRWTHGARYANLLLQPSAACDIAESRSEAAREIEAN